jgi:hypothetical protein
MEYFLAFVLFSPPSPLPPSAGGLVGCLVEMAAGGYFFLFFFFTLSFF